MTRLVITDQIRFDIKKILEHARAHPVLIDHDTRYDLQRKSTVWDNIHHVIEIEKGFICAFSFEKQPSGLYRHLSVALKDSALLANPGEVDEIRALFEFKREMESCWFSLDQISPTQNAITLIDLAD